MTATVPAADLRGHPAKYSDIILEALRVRINDEYRRINDGVPAAEREPITVFDPFAGVGRIWRLHRAGSVHVEAMELEPEWAGHDPRTVVGDSITYMRSTDRRYDAIATSISYGNRLADCHDARDGSDRKSYRHMLGRMPTEGSSCVLPWGRRYKAFHAEFYRLVARCLVPGGLLLLNVSNFQRQGVMINAVQWHDGACWGAGLEQAPGRHLTLPTPRMRKGQNHEARAESEVILRFRRPEIGPRS